MYIYQSKNLNANILIIVYEHSLASNLINLFKKTNSEPCQYAVGNLASYNIYYT